MSLSVYCPQPPSAAFERTLAGLLDPDVRVTMGPDTPEPAAWRVLVDRRPTKELLERSPDLAALVIPDTDVPAATCALMRRYPHIAVHNLHHEAAPTAEAAMALLLAAAKRIRPAGLSGSDRPDGESRALLVEGRSALIVGYGSIGRRIAQACHAFGLRVQSIRRQPGNEGGTPTHPPEMLRPCLGAAKVVFVCVPATPATQGMIGAAELEQLPPGAILVDVSRAGVVDVRALVEGLRRGRPAAAGVDQWPRRRELGVLSARLDLANLVVSEHPAGRCEDTESLRGAHLAVLLNIAAKGQVMPNRVDLAAGY